MMSRIPASLAGWEMVDFTVGNGCGMHRYIKTCQNFCFTLRETRAQIHAGLSACRLQAAEARVSVFSLEMTAFFIT